MYTHLVFLHVKDQTFTLKTKKKKIKSAGHTLLTIYQPYHSSLSAITYTGDHMVLFTLVTH